MQQSKVDEDQAESKLRQLSNPQIKLPLHSESLSQSPSPTPQGLEEVQQLQASQEASQPSQTKMKK